MFFKTKCSQLQHLKNLDLTSVNFLMERQGQACAFNLCIHIGPYTWMGAVNDVAGPKWEMQIKLQ